jgi:tetratricopeptide (TPR) repeat protein
MTRRRVVLIGWDAADWKVINPLLDFGQMPGLQSIVESGVKGDVASLHPMISPLLWTSIATGHSAARHGIASFHEPDPVTGTVRLVSATSRKVKALWNILTHEGLNSLVVNWYASQPAEPIQGACVSNLFPNVRAPIGQPWPLAAGAVHPPHLRSTLAGLRIHPGELTGDDLLPFIPDLALVDQTRDHRPLQLAIELAGALSVHAAATWLMENEPWDFLAVYFPSLDHLSHYFMPYYPPRLASVSEKDFDTYRHVIPAAYRYHDLMLQRTIALAGPETTFIVLSDHGFHSDEFRPPIQPPGWLGWQEEWLTRWHRTHGILCASGPGLRRDEILFGAGLMDITPFILTLFGLPAGLDMPGRILPDAFETPPDDTRIPSWEEVSGECGMLPPQAEPEEWESAEALAQLADLGYIENTAEQGGVELEKMAAHRSYTLARVHVSEGNYAEAIPALEQSIAFRAAPECRLLLAHCYFREGRHAPARELTEAVLAENPNRPHALLIQANLELAEGRPGKALVLLSQAEGMPFPNGVLQYRIGCVYAAMQRWEDAEQAFARSIAADPEFPEARRNRAKALLALGRIEEAASTAVDAIALRYDDAGSHLLLGSALAQSGRIEQAVQAFEASLRLRPNADAHDWLAAIHERRGDEERAARHRGLSRALHVAA